MELCFLLGQGAHFCKNREKIWPKSEKCTRKTLDGKFDAYMCRLGGPRSGNVKQSSVFNAFLKVQKGHGYSKEKLGLSEWSSFWLKKTIKKEGKRGTAGLETRAGKYDAYMLGLGGAEKRTC